MSNNTSKNSNTALTSCSPSTCNDYGTCKVLNPGMSTEWYECICDLWHSGQNCEFQVPLPLVVAVTSTVFACLILFFCWCSSYKFSKRKIHIPKNRRRFVDLLHKHQKREKHWLRAKLDAETKRTGKTRDIPYDDQTDQETDNDKKKPKKEEKKEEVKKEEVKTEVPKRPEPNRERELEKLKEEETAQQMRAEGKLKREMVSMEDAPEPSNRDPSQRSTSTISTTTSSGGLRDVTGIGSSTTNALPEDAPKDNKDAYDKKKKKEAQQEKWAEMASAELNKKHKKK